MFEGFKPWKKKVEVAAAAGLALGAVGAAEVPLAEAASVEKPGPVLEHQEKIGERSVMNFARLYQEAFPHLKLGTLRLNEAPPQPGDAGIRGFRNYEVYCTDDTDVEKLVGTVTLGPTDLAAGAQPTFNVKMGEVLDRQATADDHYLHDYSKGLVEVFYDEKALHNLNILHVKFDRDTRHLVQTITTFDRQKMKETTQATTLLDITQLEAPAKSVVFESLPGVGGIAIKVTLADGSKKEYLLKSLSVTGYEVSLTEVVGKN